MNDAKAPLTPPLSPRAGRGRTLRLGSRQRLFLHTSFAGMTKSAAKRTRFFSRWRALGAPDNSAVNLRPSALGDLAALSIDGHDHRLVERLDQQRRQVFRARSARVAGLALLESAVHRRLAAADLVIALVVGHGAPHPFHPARRGRHRRLLPQRSSALSSRTMRNYQFINYCTGNDRAMPNGDPRVFGFPCRFPARLSILVERRAQVDDPTRFFGAGGVPKNFYPEFSRAAGKLERRRYPAESGGGRAI